MLKDFSLEQENIFGTTTDAGPDVKATVKKHVTKNWEWCPPHMLSRMASAAFGTKVTRANKIIREMSKAINKVRDISKSGTLVQELQASNDSKKMLKSFLS